MSLTVNNNNEPQTNLCSQILNTVGPLATRLIVTKVLENTKISPLIKDFLICSATGMQLLYDSRRLSRYTSKNFGEKPEESNWRWAGRKIGNAISYAMTLSGAYRITTAATSIIMWGQEYNWTANQINSVNTAITSNAQEQHQEASLDWRIPGTHDIQRDNTFAVDETLVRAHFQELRNRQSPVVSFQEQHLSFKPVENGVCTAKSLSIALRTMQERCIERGSMKCFQDAVREVGTETSITERTIQAALNSIALSPEAAQNLSRQELTGEKVAALTDFFGLQIDPKNPIDINAKMPDAICIGRATRPTNNHKGEYYGHSILVCKTGDSSALFDPGIGAIGFPTSAIEERTKNLCLGSRGTWLLDNFLFFKLSANPDKDKKDSLFSSSGTPSQNTSGSGAPNGKAIESDGFNIVDWLAKKLIHSITSHQQS